MTGETVYPMTDQRLFFIAGGGMLAGGLIAGLLLGENARTSNPLVALLLAGAIAGGGAVLVQRVANG